MSTACSSWRTKLPIRPSTEPAMVNYCSPTDARPSCHRAHGKDVAGAVREARARAAAARAVAAREARSAAREARGAGGRGAGEAGGSGAGGAGGAGGPVVVAGLRPARRPRPVMRPDWLNGFSPPPPSPLPPFYPPLSPLLAPGPTSSTPTSRVSALVVAGPTGGSECQQRIHPVCNDP